MRYSTCDMTRIAQKVRDARRVRGRVAKEMRPLFNHMLKLGIDSAKRGYCLRAGGEIARAKRMATKYPEAGLSGVRRAKKRRR